MEVILIENVDKLGSRGQIVKVAAGYGRNHLLPKKLAVAANAQNRKWVEQQRQKFLKQEAHERSEAAELGKLVETVRLVFKRKTGEHGAIFGSVTAMDIAEQLVIQGYNIDRRKIQLSSTLKAIGVHDVPVKLHRDVTAALKVAVEAEGESPVAPADAKAEAAPTKSEKS
ncbi:MAG: 50S ribosomal protein L9 [Terriglobia bacterium]